MVGITALALTAAAIVVATATPRYDASADLQIQPMAAYGTDALQGLDVFRQPTDGSSAAVTAARLFASPQYSRPFRERFGKSAGSVAIAVTPLSQADLVSIGASGPQAATAARAANEYAATIIAQRKAQFESELQQRIAQVAAQMRAIPTHDRATNPVYATLAGQLGTLRGWLGQPDPTVLLLAPATAPLAPAWPRTRLTLFVSIVIGLLLGLAAAVALELVNPRVTREDELEQTHRLPILARVPRMSSHTVDEYLRGRMPLPADVWRGYRTLRAVLANAGIEGGFPRSILVTSASPGDGKTLTAVNVALALAAADLRVTLVDADFYRPMIGTIFNVTARRDGFVRLLENPDAARNGAVPAPTHPRLKLLLASREQVHRLQLFSTRRVEQVLDRLGQESDVVVIDSPPLPEVAETLGLAEAVEAVVVCVRIGHTRRDRLGDLRDLLARRGVTPLGFFVSSRGGSQPTMYDGYAPTFLTTPAGTSLLTARAMPPEEEEAASRATW